MQALLSLHANYPGGTPGVDYNGTAPNPRYSLVEDQILRVDLDGNAGGYENWITLSGTGPYQEGTTTSAGSFLSGIEGNMNTGFYLRFDPLDNFEGNVTFDLNSSAAGTGLMTTHSFRVEMISANDTPRLKFRDSSNISEVFNASASYSVAENQQLVAHVYGDELDAGDVVTLSLPVGVGDNDRFDINFTNQIRFKSTGANFELPFDVGGLAGDNTYVITVLGTDNFGLQVQQTVSIAITDLDEKPVTQPEGSQSFTITEDKTGSDFGSFYLARGSGEYLSITATDPEPADTAVRWTLSSPPSKGKVYYSASSGAFPMGTASELTTASSVLSSVIYLDYHPDGNATTESSPESFTVRAVDMNNPSLHSDFTINVTIDPENNDPPVWNPSGQPGGVYDYSILEANSTDVIASLTATDADISETKTYSIVGGADQAFFDIGSGTGQLRFKPSLAPINFESKIDTDGNDVFELTVRVTDGTYNVDLSVTVTLLDTNEAPQILPLSGFTNSLSVMEGSSWSLPSNFLGGSDVDFGDDNQTGGGEFLG
ncbi:cadherin repeat domain-containing protein [Verrucomicrobia bacterium]|nr:cadherin repeat domain-containing protein [Verrucomicrobiota bacterium]